MNTELLWNNFLSQIKERISPISYETWFRDTKLVSLRNNIALVVVPMPFHKKHLQENYIDIIEDKFNSLTGSTFSFNFILEEEWEVKKNEEFKEQIIVKEESKNSFKDGLKQMVNDEETIASIDSTISDRKKDKTIEKINEQKTI